jgi:hypothetical protein
MMYRFRARRFRRMLSYHVRPIGPILTPDVCVLCTHLLSRLKSVLTKMARPVIKYNDSWLCSK